MATINLLPQELKEGIYYSRKNIKAIRRLWLVLVFLLILVLVFFALYRLLSTDLSSVKKEVAYEEENIKSYGDLEKEAKKLSERLEIIGKIEDNYPYFSKILTEITSLMPPNSNLTSIEVFKDNTQRAKITGLADTKRAVAIFREALENSPHFSYVDIETIVFDRDRTQKEKFTIFLTIEKDGLK